MRKLIKNRFFQWTIAVLLAFALGTLASKAWGGTFTTTYNGVEYEIKTPECFPEKLTQQDVTNIVHRPRLVPRLNTLLFHRDNEIFGIMVGSELGKEDLYPVGAAHIKTNEDSTWSKFWNYLDYKTPTEATKAEAEAWAQGHRFGKPPLKPVKPKTIKPQTNSTSI